MFNVWKNDVQVGSMSNLVNLGKALLDSMFDVSFVRSQKQGVRVQSPIDEHDRVLSMFEKWCSSIFDGW